MTTSSFWGMIVLASLIGAGLGAALAWRAARSRFRARLAVTAQELQHQHASVTKELRAAQARAQTELEQARQSFKRQLASAAEGPRAATMMAEERLRAAYDELDRLRRQATRLAKPELETNDGFAATQTMAE